MPERIDINPPSLGIPATDEDAKARFVSLPPGLRDIRLTDQAASEMRNLLDNANQPTPTGREMPVIDASVLREKIQALLVEGMNSGEVIEIDEAFWQERRRVLQERIATRKNSENA